MTIHHAPMEGSAAQVTLLQELFPGIMTSWSRTINDPRASIDVTSLSATSCCRGDCFIADRYEYEHNEGLSMVITETVETAVSAGGQRPSATQPRYDAVFAIESGRGEWP